MDAPNISFSKIMYIGHGKKIMEGEILISSQKQSCNLCMVVFCREMTFPFPSSISIVSWSGHRHGRRSVQRRRRQREQPHSQEPLRLAMGVPLQHRYHLHDDDNNLARRLDQTGNRVTVSYP